MYYFLVIALLAGTCYGQTPSAQYIDAVLRNLQNEIRVRSLDNFPVSNFTAIISGSSNIKKVDFFRGTIHGFSYVRRNGVCSPLSYVANNVTLDCSLIFDRVSVSYDGLVTPKSGSKVPEKANVTLSTTYVYIKTTTNRYSNRPVLVSFTITQLGNFYPVLSGRGASMGDQRTVAANLGNHVVQNFNNIFYYQLQPAVAAAVSRTPMPN